MRSLLDGRGVRILLLLVPLAAYVNSISNPFHYDDFHSIVDNEHIRSLANVPSFFVDPGTFSSVPDNAMYRPLLLASYALNYAISGYDVWSYHLAAMLMHAASTLLVFAIGSRLLGDRAGGLLAALLFGLHPVNSESVNYISSRSELAGGLFVLVGFWAFLLRAPERRLPPAGLVLIGGSYAAGLLSKSVAIVLPAILLAHELIVARRRPSDGRFYGILAALAVGYLAVVGRFLHTAVASEPVRSYAEQLFSQGKAMVFYLKLLAWPAGLNVDHQFQLSNSVLKPFDPAAAGALLFGLSLLFFCWYHRRRHPLPGFFLAVALLALAPASLVPLNVLVNEHRLYLASAAFAWLVAYVVLRVVAAGPRWRLIGIAVMVVALLGLAGGTVARNRVWASHHALWSDAADKAPLMARPHFYVAEALAERGDDEGAIAALERAIRNDPGFAAAYGRLGELLLGRAPAHQAVDHLNRAVRLEPDDPGLWRLLGDSYRHRALQALPGEREQDWNDGLIAYRRALQLRPEEAGLYNNVGVILQELGRPKEAMAYHLRAATLEPLDARTQINIGAAHWMLGAVDEAIAAFEDAVEIDPASSMAWHNLATLYSRAGMTGKARAALQRASVPARVDTGHGEVSEID